MRRQVLFVAASLVAVMLLASQVSARSTAANTWAGVWDSDFGKLTLDAGGSGSYEGFNPGTVSGTVTGNVDKGTWSQPGNPPKDGTFEWTLSGDGHSFSGTWAYTAGGCGSACGWGGTCISGPCMMNSAGSTPPVTTTPKPPAPPNTPVTVKLSVKRPSGSYGSSVKAPNGAVVWFRAVAGPSLPDGAKVVIEYPWQGGVRSLADCSTAVCETTLKYQNAKLAFSAVVVKDGNELARSASVTVAWSKRVVKVTAALTVKAPGGRFASSARGDVGTNLKLRAVIAPRLPAGARAAIKMRKLGTKRELFFPGGGCSRALCEFSTYNDDPETWEFRVVVLVGSTELASSSYVTIIWCYCHEPKKVNVWLKYFQTGVTPVYSPDCATTADPFDQDWPGQIGPSHAEAIIKFKTRKDYLFPPKHVFLRGEIISAGDFTDGIQAYDRDADGKPLSGIEVLQALRCRGSSLSLRMVDGTATLEVTPTERTLTVQVRLNGPALLNETCHKAVATLRIVDSDVHLTGKGANADGYSLTGWSPACPHEHGFSMTNPIAFAIGPPGNWVGPWGSTYTELNCQAPDGSGRGPSGKECA